MKKVLSLIVCVMLAIGALSAMPAFAAADDAYLGHDAASGWYNVSMQLAPGESNEHAIQVLPTGAGQTLWAMHIQITCWDYMHEQGGLTTWRYLHYKTDGNLTKLASSFAHGYDASKEKPLPMEAGEYVVDIIELAGEDAVKNGEMLDVYWYLAAAAPEGAEFEYIYLSKSAEKDTNDTPSEDDPVESTPEETPVESTPEESPVESTPEEDASSEETPVESTPEEDASSEEAPVESTPDKDDAVSSESTTGNAPTGPSVGIIIAIVAAVVIIAGAVVVTLVVLKKKAAPAAEAAEESTEE